MENRYNELVRHYTTTSMHSGVTFACISCEYRVNTREFNCANGNPRTQAATAINEHAALLHPGTATSWLRPASLLSLKKSD
jgi:hypothetical protein